MSQTILANHAMVAQTEWEDFILIPDDYFIFKTLDLPRKLSAKKIPNMILGLLSDDSPFPLDQLMWGYLPLNRQKTQWVYFMGLKERLQNFIGNPPREKHLLPCAALGILLAKEDEICTVTCNGMTSVLVQKKPSVCIQTDNTRLPSPAENPPVENPPSSLPKRNLSILQMQEDRHHYRCCLSEQTGDTPAQTTTVLLPRKLVWQADLRDKDQIQQLKKQEYSAYILQRSTKWGFYGLGIVFCFQFFLWIGQAALYFRNKSIEAKTPVAQKWKSKDRLVRKIQPIWDQEVSFFELLGLINTYRPKGIYFTHATTDQPHHVVVEAIADNQATMDAYVQNLQKSQYFSSVEASEAQPFEQGVKFHLSCNFQKTTDSFFRTISSRQ